MNAQPKIKVIFNGLGPGNTYHSTEGECIDGVTKALPLDEAVSIINTGYAIEATPESIKRVKVILEADVKKRKEYAEKIENGKGGNK